MSKERDSVSLMRGVDRELPPSLPLGEPVITTDKSEMWYGMGDNAPLKKIVDQEALTKIKSLESGKRDKETKITRHDLDTSREDSKIRMQNLGEDVRQAIAGTAPVLPTIGAGDVNNTHLADECVTPSKIATYGVGDLLDLSTVTNDYYVNKQGEIVSYAGNGGVGGVTDYIQVRPNSEYTHINSNTNGAVLSIPGCMYNYNKELIGPIPNNSLEINVFNTPDNCHYVRVNLGNRLFLSPQSLYFRGDMTTEIQWLQLITKNFRESSVPFSSIIESSIQIKPEHIVLEIESVNLFDKTQLVQGQYAHTDGKLVDNPGYTSGRTKHIQVVPNRNYRIYAYSETLSQVGCFYDYNKNFVANFSTCNITEPQKGEVIIQAPTNAYYMVLNYSSTYVDITYIYAKDHKYQIPWLNVATENISSDLASYIRSIPDEHITPTMLNKNFITQATELFNKDTNFIEGEYAYINGSIKVADSYKPNGRSDFMPVSENITYEFLGYVSSDGSNHNLGCVYDIDKQFICYMNSTPVDGKENIYTMLMPKNAGYVILNVSSKYLASTYFKECIVTEYTIDWLKVLSSNLNKSSVKTEHLDQEVIDLISSSSDSTSSRYTGMKATWVGDSITYGVGTTSNDKRYSVLVRDALGMSVSGYQNMGVSGSVIARKQPSDTNWTTKSVVERVCDEGQIKANQDIIFLLGGVNDFARKTPFSTMAESLAYFKANGTWEDTTFYGALHRVITYIRDNHPNSEFVFITTIHYDVENTRHSDRTLKQYIDIIREVCEYYAVPVIDLFKDLPLDPKNATHRRIYTSGSGGNNPDGCHPSDLGNKLMADKIVSYLKYNYL